MRTHLHVTPTPSHSHPLRFDEDEIGALTQEQLVRALIKTYNLSTDLNQVRTMARSAARLCVSAAMHVDAR